MQRRKFIQLLSVLPLTAPAITLAAALSPVDRRLLIQNSPLAGLAYYQGESLWKRFHISDPLQLIREPDNKYDRQAVAVYWRKHKLGFIPRVANTAISQMLDRGVPVQAQITRLDESDNSWKRIRFSVYATV